jgi:hypothetical protein
MNDQVTDPPTDATPTPFTEEEQSALATLQWFYQRGHDLLSPREQARLRFLRWLVETGRIEP